MDFSNVDFLLDWVRAHPGLAGFFVFVLAFAEALALVGLFLPGIALMLGVGALIGTGDLPFWPTLAWAVAGAIAGDGFSFWLGRRFHERLRILWPFSRYPELITRSAAFMDQHGGKSILFARFIGPLRPVLPAVAGMLDMPARRFIPANILSACVWAPAFLVPGAILGASLELAAEVTTRLAILILIVLVVLFSVAWTVRAVFRLVHPHVHKWIGRGLAWAELHPVAGRIPAALLDPNHREARGLTILALILFAAVVVFLLIMDAVEAGGFITGLDEFVFHSLQGARTPWMDVWMAAITALGDWQIVLPLFAAILVWLGWKKRWKAAAYWAAAAGFAVLVNQVVKITLGTLRPHAVYDGLSAFSFPSGHATSATVIYGFLAVLFARELRERYRWIAYAVGACLILAIAFSRLYLGVHWLSDVLGGLSLGLMWVALLGIAYRTHPAATLPLRGLVLATVTTMIVATTWHLPAAVAMAKTHYAPVHPVVQYDGQRWWAKDWEKLPPFRSDLRTSHRQPLNFQYAGELNRFASQLRQHGWRSPTELNGWSWLRWFGARETITALPVLPQVHAGRHETLLLAYPIADDRMWVVRLWESGAVVKSGKAPVWLGTVSLVGLFSPVPGFAVPRGRGHFEEAVGRLEQDLAGIEHRIERRPQGGGLLLAR